MLPPSSNETGSRFHTEVVGLASVFESSSLPNSSVAEAVHSIQNGPAVFVGSGGALAVAEFAAQVHRQETGHPSRADTPFGFTAPFQERQAAAVLVSAGGRNPDVRGAARAARDSGYYPVVLLTRRPVDDLPPALVRHLDSVAHVPAPADGFLATSSVVAFLASIAVGYSLALPPAIDFTQPEQPLRSRTIAVGGPPQRAAIVDLEARLSETGLSAIQIADLRNFAHGRHVGVARHSGELSVVFFADPTTIQLTEKTAALLPDDVDVRVLDSEQPFPASAIELVGRSMALTAATGYAIGVDPAKPGVPRFGRQLYRLTPSASQHTIDPVERKLDAQGMPRSQRGPTEQALQAWVASVGTVELSALVLDYDGTCCSADDRFKPLSDPVAERLASLASQGLTIAFASGRGKSLHEEVRRWMPANRWDDTLLGMYNGSVLLALNEEVGDYSKASGILAIAAQRLRESDETCDYLLEERSTQVGVTSPAGAAGQLLLPVVQSVLGRHPAVEVRVAASGHSVDIIESTKSKSEVVDALELRGHKNVLAIGDQGQPGGNDFQLLSRTPWSLSVDKVSPDLSRCWNLSAGRHSGPDALLAYLRCLKKTKQGWRLRLKVQP